MTVECVDEKLSELAGEGRTLCIHEAKRCILAEVIDHSDFVVRPDII